MREVTYTETLVVEECCNCGVPFGMPGALRKKRLEDGGCFYCPNGHGQHFTDPIEAKLKRLQAEKASLEKRVTNTERWAKEEQAQHDLTRRSLAATRGQVTKLRKRVGNGVCPVCNRTFSQLARHMCSQHPGFQDEELAL